MNVAYESSLGRTFHPVHFQAQRAWPSVPSADGDPHIQPETFPVLIGIRRHTQPYSYELDDEKVFSSPKYNVFNLAVDCTYQVLMSQILNWLPLDWAWPLPKYKPGDPKHSIASLYLARLRSSPTITPTSLSPFAQVAYDHVCPVAEANVKDVVRFLRQQTSDLFILSFILSDYETFRTLRMASEKTFLLMAESLNNQSGKPGLPDSFDLYSTPPRNAQAPLVGESAQRDHAPAPGSAPSQQAPGSSLARQQQTNAMPSDQRTSFQTPTRQSSARLPHEQANAQSATMSSQLDARDGVSGPRIVNGFVVPASVEQIAASARSQVFASSAHAPSSMTSGAVQASSTSGNPAIQMMTPRERAEPVGDLPTSASNSTDRRRSTGGLHVMDEEGRIGTEDRLRFDREQDATTGTEQRSRGQQGNAGLPTTGRGMSLTELMEWKLRKQAVDSQANSRQMSGDNEPTGEEEGKRKRKDEQDDDAENDGGSVGGKKPKIGGL